MVGPPEHKGGCQQHNHQRNDRGLDAEHAAGQDGGTAEVCLQQAFDGLARLARDPDAEDTIVGEVPGHVQADGHPEAVRQGVGGTEESTRLQGDREGAVERGAGARQMDEFEEGLRRWRAPTKCRGISR